MLVKERLTSTGIIYGFDLEKTLNIFQLNKKINRKSSISVWETRSSDGLYFLLVNNTLTLHVFYGRLDTYNIT